MQRLWTVVLRNGRMHGSPIFGRNQAIEVACELIAKGEPISHICPVAIEHEGGIVKASELHRIALERNRGQPHPRTLLTPEAQSLAQRDRQRR